jgi:RimJ/RimL family protein N-acetyltransferase
VAAQARHWRTLGFGLWARVERSSARTIGYAGLSVPTFLPEVLPAVEVGWRLEPESWGHGYATEAATTALEQAFTTLGLAEVISLPQVDNPPSVRVAERLGMQLHRTVTAPATAKRGPVEVAVMSMTCSEWEAWKRR